MSADWFLIATQSRPSGCTQCPVHDNNAGETSNSSNGGQLSSVLAQCRSLRQLHARTAMQRLDDAVASADANNTSLTGKQRPEIGPDRGPG